jgi:hypothetical protein
VLQPDRRAGLCSPKTYDLPSSATLYRNNGHGTFSDVTDRAGLRAAVGGLGVVAGDVDGDGGSTSSSPTTARRINCG